MNDTMIRTTITFPRELHRRLRIDAISRGITLNALVLQKLGRIKTKKTTVEEDLAFFEKIRKRGPQFDAAQAVREDRDSH